MPIDTSTSFILPLGLLAGALTFIIIGYTAWNAIEFGSGLMSRMITFNPAYGPASMGSIAESAAGTAGATIVPLLQKASPMSLYQRFNEYKSNKAYRNKINDVGTKLDEIQSPPRGGAQGDGNPGGNDQAAAPANGAQGDDNPGDGNNQ